MVHYSKRSWQSISFSKINLAKLHLDRGEPVIWKDVRVWDGIVAAEPNAPSNWVKSGL